MFDKKTIIDPPDTEIEVRVIVEDNGTGVYYEPARDRFILSSSKFRVSCDGCKLVSLGNSDLGKFIVAVMCELQGHSWKKIRSKIKRVRRI